MITKITAALLATSLMVACGGTTTPPVTAPVTTPAVVAPVATPAVVAVAAPKTFNQLTTEFNDIFNLYGGGNYQNPNTLPTTPGAVSYQGVNVLTIDPANPVTFRGTSSLTLDLSKASGFSGTFSDFVSSTDTSVPGTLIISNGAINRTGIAGQNTALTGNLGGQLTVNNNPIVFNGIVGGDVVLPTRQFLDGIMQGTATFGGVTGTFTGDFVAKK